MAFQVTVEWSSRSKALQSRLRQKVSGTSFWLSPATPPAQFGVVAPQEVGVWYMAKTVPMSVTTDLAGQSATATVPDGPAYVRMDFDLVATAGGHSSTILALRQLFLATSSITPPGMMGSGTLLPVQFSIEDMELVASANGPVRRKGPSPTGHRTGLGLHPLLSLAKFGQFSINAEFVDVTELWWKVHPDTTWGWYWHPLLKGRQEHLRVLAWTGGGNPMIWFAAIPDAAVTSSAKRTELKTVTPRPVTRPADIVFFRPPPGSNAFPYSPTQAGFEAKQHDDISLVNLARYLLSPVPEKTFLALKSAGVRTPELLADQIQPKSSTPTVKPADPMDLMKLLDPSGRSRPEAFTDTRANAFRPVGLEASLNRSGAAHVLFLPLGFEASEGDPARGLKGNPQGGYEAVQMADLKVTIQSALTLLWNVNAVGRDSASPPLTRDRELWTAGHSEGNRTVWRCLQGNGNDVDRLISFDSDTLTEGVKQMRAAGKKRPAGKPLHAFVVLTPANGDENGLPVERDRELRQLRDSGMLVTVLPDFAARSQYWHLNPPPITNPYFLHLLAKWNVPAQQGGGGTSRTLLEISATRPRNWNFLFFHELAVFGGELVQQAIVPGASPPASPQVRTFFEMALGAPNPRPPAGSKP
jgi:hypothetical protein